METFQRLLRGLRGRGTGRYALLVAFGIFLSRIAGLIRDRVFAHYFGNSAVADAFRAAFRIPNFLQNLFGEGVLSASFIPVYAKLLAANDEGEARRTALAVASLLAVVTSALVLIGVLIAPGLILAIAPGFSGAKRELTIELVRIFFPGAGLLVGSAWCLGILNSHRKFFISYTAPVFWNAAIIATMLLYGRGQALAPLAATVAWGAVVGSALQFAVQLPHVLRLLGRFRPQFAWASEHVRTVINNFFPVFISRGVVQLSGYVDALLASFLPTGALAAFSYSLTLSNLPVGLFGMSVSAAELPEMSSAVTWNEEAYAALRRRMNTALRRIAWFVVPSAVAFLALGDVIAAAIYQTGRFTHADAQYVWAILAGSGVGLLASTLGRLYSSAFYALYDTRTPLRFAVIRVGVAGGLGYFAALPLPPLLGIAPRWGVAGLTATAGLAAWLEFTLLRRALNRRIGATGISARFMTEIWGIAIAAAGVAWIVRLHLPAAVRHPVYGGIAILGAYGVVYVGGTALVRLRPN